MIKQFGGQFVEFEKYDKVYGLKSLRWPEKCGRNRLVESYDTFESNAELSAESLAYASQREIKHHNNRRCRIKLLISDRRSTCISRQETRKNLIFDHTVYTEL